MEDDRGQVLRGTGVGSHPLQSLFKEVAERKVLQQKACKDGPSYKKIWHLEADR